MLSPYLTRVCSLRTIAIFLLALSCALAVGCKEDPQKAKVRHLEKGKQFLLEKKFREARLEFRNALALDKKYADAFMGLADASMGLNNVQEAYEALLQVKELDPKNLEAKARIGNLYLLNTRVSENVTAAEDLANQVLTADPNYVEGYILRAGVATSRQKWADAEQDLKKAIELNPKRVESHLSYARYYDQRAKGEADAGVRAKFNAEAEKIFRQAVALDAKSSIAHLALADFLFSAQRTGEAETELKAAVEADPKDQIALAATARFYESQKNFGEAEKFINRLTELSGDKNEGRSQIIDLHARDGKIDQAIAEYQELVKQSPKYLRAYVQLSGLLLRKGDINGATQQIEAAMKVNKQDTDVLFMHGRINLANGKIRDASNDFDQVLKQEPRLHQGLYWMAEAQLQNGDAERARVYTNDLLRYYPDNPAGLLMMIRVLLNSGGGNQNEMAKNAAEALKIADKIVNGIAALKTNSVAMQASRLDPETLSDVEAKGYTARAAAKLYLRDYSGAQADLERSIQIDPRNPEAKANLAGLYLLKKDVANARTQAEQAVEIGPSSDAAINSLVNAYLMQQDYAAAHQKLDALIASQPFKKAFLLDKKVDVYTAQKDGPNVEKTLRQIIEVEPNYLNTYFKLFAFYKNQNQVDRAINELQQLVNRRPDNPRQMAQAYMLLGMMQEEKGQFDEALKDYEKSIGYDARTPVASIALNNLAWLMADKGKGNLDKATEHARNAIQLSPNVGSFYDTLGYVLYKKGMHNVAVEQFLKAIEKQPGEPNYHRHLARAYQDSGDKAKALQSYNKALQLGGATYRDADAVKSEIAKLR